MQGSSLKHWAAGRRRVPVPRSQCITCRRRCRHCISFGASWMTTIRGVGRPRKGLKHALAEAAKHKTTNQPKQTQTKINQSKPKRKQTNRQTNKQTNKQASKQSRKQASKQASKQTNKQVDTDTQKRTHTHAYTRTNQTNMQIN